MRIWQVAQKYLELDNSTTVVKAELRKGWLHLAAIYIGLTICVPVFVWGIQMAGQMHFPDFAAACFAGGALAGAIAFLTGYVGARSGLTTPLLMRLTLGSGGALVTALLFAVTSFGWFGVQTQMFAESLVSLGRDVFHADLPYVPVVIFSGLLMSTTAVIGFSALGRLSFVAVPLLLFLLFVPLFRLGNSEAIGALLGHAPGSHAMTLGVAVSAISGAYMSGAVLMPDITRFMRSGRDVFYGVVANFALAYPLILLLAGVVGLLSGKADLLQVMFAMGLGIPAIFTLLLATWTTNDTNVYSGALALSAMVKRVPRWQLAIVTGVLGTCFALMDLVTHFVPWLTILGIVCSPLAGVYVVDYFVRKSYYEKAGAASVPAVRLLPLLAWGAGIVVGFVTAPADAGGLGLGYTLTTVPPLDAILAAMLAQFAFSWLGKGQKV